MKQLPLNDLSECIIKSFNSWDSFFKISISYFTLAKVFFNTLCDFNLAKNTVT